MSNIINRTDRDSLGRLLRRSSVNTPEIDTDDWLVNPDLSGLEGIVDEKYWKVTGVAPGGAVEEMDAGEKAAQDAALLDAAKTARRQALAAEAWAYIEAANTAGEQRMFHSLYMDARATAKNNRADHIELWLAWMELIAAEARTEILAVNAAGTVAEVNAVVLDTATLDGLKPAVSLMNTMAIPD